MSRPVASTMVVTIALESDEAKAAAEAAGESGTLLLVPKVGARRDDTGAWLPAFSPDEIRAIAAWVAAQRRDAR